MLVRSPRRTAAVLLGTVALLLPGCGRLIEGQGQTSDGVRPNVASSTLEIFGSTDDDIDTLSRNALADLETYWADVFPEVYGAEFQPLAGGYFSVDPDNFDQADYPDDIGCFDGPEDVENNAFYCFPQPGGGDNVVYDRTLLAGLAADYGRFIPALVMAHEFGHAIQGRQAPPSTLSIVFETQADCFAGAWTGWVADDNAEHFFIRPAELDDVLRGYLLLRDAPGSGPMEDGAHGSYFDRVSAFQEGYQDGAQACKDNYTDNRIFTQQEFNDQVDFDNEGNAPYDEAITISEDTLDAFWSTQFGGVFDGAWSPPTLQPYEGPRPECDGARQRRDVTFCEAENRVDFDNQTLMPAVHTEVGDFAVSTLLSINYAQAARAQLGL
ncbi:MAG: hypothetical protein H0V67_02355, partial [Geodermatophilaceae bacterium]|nr:hypothetical protein [Geodermatophilaceae bacterium]